MTPELRRAIALLKLSNSELTHELKNEAEANPVLIVKEPQADLTLQLWDVKARRHKAPPPGIGIGGGLAETLGIAGSPGLQEHIRSQMRLLLHTVEDFAIAEELALAVTPWGWLDRPLTEIADELGKPRAKIESVLARVQHIEPAGLFARDLRECLWLQARDQEALSPVMECVLDNLPMLGEKKLNELAELAGATVEDISHIFRVIRSLDPKPGLQFDPAPPPPAEPDIIVQRKAGQWFVSINHSTLPEIKVNASADADIRQRRNAEVLKRAVARRNETLLVLASEIVQIQKGWLEEGPARHAPMSFASLAAALDLHETTVGRLAAGRMMSTPRGTVTLRALCSQTIATLDGGAVSAIALRHRIAEMIHREGTRALSDAQIAKNLAQSGVSLARRTVAKYRAQMEIANATERLAAKNNK